VTPASAEEKSEDRHRAQREKKEDRDQEKVERPLATREKGEEVVIYAKEKEEGGKVKERSSLSSMDYRGKKEVGHCSLHWKERKCQ